jgi:hypothetical protein
MLLAHDTFQSLVVSYFARLLDRDQIIAEEQLEEEDESDFLKGFKVSISCSLQAHL